MSRLVAVALAVPLLASPAQAQPEPPTETPAPARPDAVYVVGRVITSLGRPLANALITVEGGDGTVYKTDSKGYFRLEVPIGTTLVVDYPNLDTTIVVVDGRSLDDVVLVDSSETIEVEGDAPPPVSGAAKLDRDELQRVPGAGGDIVKALTVMPGVVNLQLPLGYSGVVIRGSSPQDSRVLIDDFEVPVLFHNIGFRAIVPAESIATLDYLPGGYDVAYGRASSGIVALTTRGGADDASAQAEVSFIDGGLVAQGPIGRDTRYMFALRRSTIDFVLPSLVPDNVDLSLTTVPRYWDEQIRIDHKLNSRWRLAFSNLGTDDIFELYATKNEDADAKRFFNRTRFARLSAAAKYNNGPWSANVALSGIAQEFTFELGKTQFIRTRYYGATPRVEVARSAPAWAGLTNVLWRLGGEMQVGRYTIDIALPTEQREGEPMPELDPEDVSTRFTGTIWTPDYAAWTALSANLDPRIKVTAGLRGEIFQRAGEGALQPRGELSWKLAKQWTARLSSGAFRRPPEYQSELLAEQLRSERSIQNIAGLAWEPREGIRAQTSAYYIARSALVAREPDGALGNNGRGTTVGAELLGTYKTGPWFAWLSYSYSHSTRVDQPGGEERLFTFDQPHSMNAAVSWKRGKWQLGGRFQLYSGLPITSPTGSIFDSDRNIYIPLYENGVNNERAPMHHQLDLRVDRSWQWGQLGMTFFIDVQNVYMNDSIVTYFYSYDYSQRAAFRSLPIIPSLGLRGVL